MSTKKLILGAVVSFIVMFVISYLWHLIILGNFYHAGLKELNLAPPSPLMIALAYIVLVVLMAIMYPIGYKGGAGWLEGLRFGILIGLVAMFPANLIFGPIFKEPFTVGLVDVIWHVVEQGIGGLLLGLIASGGGASEATE